MISKQFSQASLGTANRSQTTARVTDFRRLQAASQQLDQVFVSLAAQPLERGLISDCLTHLELAFIWHKGRRHQCVTLGKMTGD